MNREHGRSATRKGAKGKTDWTKLRTMLDSEVVFTEDAPSTSPEDWTNAIAHRGLPVPFRKTQIALHVEKTFSHDSRRKALDIKIGDRNSEK